MQAKTQESLLIAINNSPHQPAARTDSIDVTNFISNKGGPPVTYLVTGGGNTSSSNSVFGIVFYNQGGRSGGVESKISTLTGGGGLSDSPIHNKYSNHNVGNSISSSNVIFPKIDKF